MNRMIYEPTEAQRAKWAKMTIPAMPTDDYFRAEWARRHGGKVAGWGIDRAFDGDELSADADAREVDRLYPYRPPELGPTITEQSNRLYALLTEADGATFDHDGESVTTWPRYLNAYIEERRYGGPEEGGWWYDAEYPLTDGVTISTADDGFTALATPKHVSVQVGNPDQFLMTWPAFEKRIDDAADPTEDRVRVYLEAGPPWHTPRPRYE